MVFPATTIMLIGLTSHVKNGPFTKQHLREREIIVFSSTKRTIFQRTSIQEKLSILRYIAGLTIVLEMTMEDLKM